MCNQSQNVKSFHTLLPRVVAHAKWGSDEATLLHLYRSLIRSKLDYGAIVYGSARKSYWIRPRIRHSASAWVHFCHGRFVGPMFSIVVHPVFYHFTTLLAFVAPTSSRLSQLRSLNTPVCLGPPEDCKLPSRSRDAILRESSELKKEIRQYVSLASIELKLS